jgi:hypothetical protein
MMAHGGQFLLTVTQVQIIYSMSQISQQKYNTNGPAQHGLNHIRAYTLGAPGP